MRQGKAVEGESKSVLPLMRQVQLGAGPLALTGAALSWWVDPRWILLSGFCGMAEILAKMPWNRASAGGAS